MLQLPLFFIGNALCLYLFVLLWSSCISVYSSYLQRELSEKTFIFIFLQNERKFRPKFAITLVMLQDNLFILLLKFVRATGRWNLLFVISVLTTVQSSLMFLAKSVKRRNWKIRKSCKKIRVTEGKTWRNPGSLNIEMIQ